MDAVRHEFLVELAPVVEEDLADVQPMDDLLIGILANDLIDLAVAKTLSVGRFRATWEDSEKQNLRLGQPHAKFLQKRQNPVGDARKA